VLRGTAKQALVSAQHQCLDGKQQGPDAQQHGGHQSNGVDDMQREERAAAQLVDRPDVKMLAAEADEKVCNIVHLIYNAKNYEGIAKDYEFSRRTMEQHWAAGYDDVVRAISHPEVLRQPDRLEGVRTFDWARSGQN